MKGEKENEDRLLLPDYLTEDDIKPFWSAWSTERRRRIRYAMLIFMVLFPLALSLFVGHGRFDLDGDKTTNEIRKAFDGGVFLLRHSEFIDLTGLSGRAQKDGCRILIQGNFCLFAGIVLLYYARDKKQPHLYPLILTNSVYSFFVFLSVLGDWLLCQDWCGAYNRLMLWGRYLRCMSGVWPYLLCLALISSLVYYLAIDIKKTKTARKE